MIGNPPKKKGFEIGELEAEVLGLLNSMEIASAGDIAEKMQSTRTIAYTTVSTTLDRLYKKGLVSRTTTAGKTGPKYVYGVATHRGVEKQLVDAAVDRLVDAFGPSVTSTIYDRLSEISPAELERIRDSIAKRRRINEPS